MQAMESLELLMHRRYTAFVKVASSKHLTFGPHEQTSRFDLLRDPHVVIKPDIIL
jgi:hypothetical protein